MKATKNKTSITLSSTNEDIIEGITLASKELNMSFDELANALKQRSQAVNRKGRGRSKT
jgi:ribosome-binding protein aMBF1 (putative translation factor)